VTQQFSISAKKNQHWGKWIHDFATIEKDIYFLNIHLKSPENQQLSSNQFFDQFTCASSHLKNIHVIVFINSLLGKNNFTIWHEMQVMITLQKHRM
jgi:hypothetical protein